ncbi:MAG: hypothetical protein AAF602_13880, partial [Myxococcota bacterium]
MFLLTLATFAPNATAEDLEVDPTQEIVVWGDRFARWNDTRWYIETDVIQPWPTLLARDENYEFQTQEYRIKAIFACEKQYEYSRRRQEASCTIEDIGILANIADRRPPEKRVRNAQLVLDEIDAKLTGAAMQLRVTDDGRVKGIEIEGIPTRNRRQNRMQQTLTQVMSRLIVGYDLELQEDNQLHEGVWTEFNTGLLLLQTQSIGSNYVKHYLNKFDNHIMVQSIGKGVSEVSGLRFAARFDVHLDGVSLFDADEGFLTDRVWAIKGTSTPSGSFNTLEYTHHGQVRMLGTRDRPDCGKSRVVNGR